MKLILDYGACSVAVVRRYRSGDRSAVLALQAKSDVDLAVVVPESFYHDLENIEAAYEGGAFVVADFEDNIVGMGGLLRTGEIVRIRVDARHRRKGIASWILEDLLVHARNLGLRCVFLHTLSEQFAAQQLYEATGFHASERGQIHGNSIIAYELDLETSAT